MADLIEVEIAQELDRSLELVALASQAEGCLGIIEGATQQIPGACQVLQQRPLLLFQAVQSSLQAHPSLMDIRRRQAGRHSGKPVCDPCDNHHDGRFNSISDYRNGNEIVLLI